MQVAAKGSFTFSQNSLAVKSSLKCRMKSDRERKQAINARKKFNACYIMALWCIIAFYAFFSSFALRLKVMFNEGK